MDIKRRDFLKLSAAMSTALVPQEGKASGDTAVDYSQTLGVLVDTTLCIGCRQCELACDLENTHSGRAPASFDDTLVFETHRRPADNAYTVVNRFHDPAQPDKTYTMKVQCMHCNYPACVSGCIVGALEKHPAGPVIYDAWKCIGCRYCIIACPFQIPAYEYGNALDPQVRKCTFCFERVVEQGREPACVSICPTEALTFGTRQQLIDIARARIKAQPDAYVDHIYGEHEIGGTSWMYLTPTDIKHSELPELRPDPLPPETETIQHGVFKWFVPPIALYGLLGLIMYSFRNDKNEQEAKQ